MNKLLAKASKNHIKQVAKDLLNVPRASDNVFSSNSFPIKQLNQFNTNLQQSLSGLKQIAEFIQNNNNNFAHQIQLAGSNSRIPYLQRNDQNFGILQKDTSILFSKTGENPGDSQKSGLKTGTVHADPTNTTQKPLNTEQSNVTVEDTQPKPGSKAAKAAARAKFLNAKTNTVPSSQVSRAFGFAGLGFKLATSAIGSKIKGAFSNEQTSVFDSVINEKNADMITNTLCRMRGIPLKLGQTLSIQDDNLIPKGFKEALERAQRSADIMPDSQVDQMLKQELGINWRDRFQEFDDKPIAAASIGQVHKAITKDGKHVAVKVQYPGVAESIDSDLQNLKTLITYLNLLPKTMYVDNLLHHTKIELKEECDYLLEAQKQMDIKELFKNKKGYFVPGVISELTTRRVLTSDWVDGIGIDECKEALTQEEKNRLGHRIFNLLLSQLFEFRYMQTDPNPANYFYNPELDTLAAIDYGAARRYSKEFVSTYMDIIYGSATNNPDLVYSASVKLGFLTGEESKDMKEAHVGAVMIVGEPFAYKGAFDFGSSDMTSRIYTKIPHMVKNRLKAPPQEVYSLHRVLSGTYLACMKLGAKVNVHNIFKEVYTKALENSAS